MHGRSTRIHWPLAVGRWPLAVGRWPLAVGRWPLAVGRWPLAVGRWPLAVGPTDGGSGRPGGLGRFGALRPRVVAVIGLAALEVLGIGLVAFDVLLGLDRDAASGRFRGGLV